MRKNSSDAIININLIIISYSNMTFSIKVAAAAVFSLAFFVLQYLQSGQLELKWACNIFMNKENNYK